jgi:small subunit ribosomal protein S19
MSRAKWKSPFVSNQLLQECNGTTKEIYTQSRESTIVPKFIGLTINVHNGHGFSKIKITEPMIGHKLGEFAPTRKRFSFKKKKAK